MKRNLLLLGAVALLSVEVAQAAPRISVFGVANSNSQSLTDISMGEDAKKFGIGAGVSFETSLSRGIGLEIGGLYYSRKHEYTQAGVSFTESIPVVQVPVMVRVGLLPFLSFGLGGFGAFGMGSVSYSDGSSLSFSGAGLKKTDFGALGSLRMNFPLSSSLAFFLDARYAMSLTNSSTVDATTRKFTDMQALVGLTFGGITKGGN